MKPRNIALHATMQLPQRIGVMPATIPRLTQSFSIEFLFIIRNVKRYYRLSYVDINRQSRDLLSSFFLLRTRLSRFLAVNTAEEISLSADDVKLTLLSKSKSSFSLTHKNHFSYREISHIAWCLLIFRLSCCLSTLSYAFHIQLLACRCYTILLHIHD